MTAVNVIVRKDAVHFLTDTAAIRRDRFVYEMNKVAALPHMAVLLATRGPVGALPRMSRLASSIARNYEELLERFPDAFRRSCRSRLLACPSMFLPVDVFVGGLDAQRRPCAFFITNTSFGRSGVSKYTAYEIDRISAPQVTPDVERLVDRTSNPATIAGPLFGHQRLSTDSLFVKGCSVGGSIQITSLDSKGITSRMIAAWADVLGEPLDPSLALEHWMQ